MTTLRGGTLGYAEIVALKVNRPPPPRKTRHASRCRDPDGRFPLPFLPRTLFLCPSHLIIIVTVLSSLLLLFFFFSPLPCCPPSLSLPLLYRLCLSVLRRNPRVVAYILNARQVGSRPNRSLASRCLVRCFRCSVLSLVYIK